MLTPLPPTAGWFVALAALSLLGLAGGLGLSRGPGWAMRGALVVGGAAMAVWVYLVKNPSVAVRVVPVEVLSRIEGVAAVPAFMLICGVAWGTAGALRQRRLAMGAAVVGAIYLLHGGLWMLQHTPPARSFGREAHAVVLQSQDYSCVPAAAATALNRLGVPSDEATMAKLTQTRAGTGSTLLRAMDGLRQRLVGTGIDVVVAEPAYDTLRRLPMPALTPLQFEPSRRHMVTLIRVGRGSVTIVDPMEGEMDMTREHFLRCYRREVLLFVGGRRPMQWATPRRMARRVVEAEGGVADDPGFDAAASAVSP